MPSGVVTELRQRWILPQFGLAPESLPQGLCHSLSPGAARWDPSVSFSALKMSPPCFGFASYFNKSVTILTSASYFPGRGRCEKPYSDTMEI